MKSNINTVIIRDVGDIYGNVDFSEFVLSKWIFVYRLARK